MNKGFCRFSIIALCILFVGSLASGCAPANGITPPTPAFGADYLIASDAMAATRPDAVFVAASADETSEGLPGSWHYVFGSQSVGCLYDVTVRNGEADVSPAMGTNWNEAIWERISATKPYLDADEAYGALCSAYPNSRSAQGYRIFYFAYAPASDGVAEISNAWVISAFDDITEKRQGGSASIDSDPKAPSTRSYLVDAVTGAVSPLQ